MAEFLLLAFFRQLARSAKSVRKCERWKEYGLTGSRQEEVWWL
jgi:hypothetical protein